MQIRKNMGKMKCAERAIVLSRYSGFVIPNPYPRIFNPLKYCRQFAQCAIRDLQSRIPINGFTIL